MILGSVDTPDRAMGIAVSGSLAFVADQLSGVQIVDVSDAENPVIMSEVASTEPLPSTSSLLHWFEYSTKVLPFLEGVAAINLAAEGQVVGAFGSFARGLQEHYGLSRSEVAFWDVHEIADAEHSEVGDSIVTRSAGTKETQDGIRRTVAVSLQMWWKFFDDIRVACGQDPA